MAENSEQLTLDDKDYTRPTFFRKTGEIGLFIDVYDAVPNSKDAFGSRQYFLMTLVDRFYKEVCQGELFKIKGFFHKRNLLHDVTLEYFHPGVLLVVNTNSRDGLKQMIDSYENGKLNAAFVECFVTDKLENKLEVKHLKLKIKLFQDELDAVETEWQMKEIPQTIDISSSEKDMRMVYIIKRFQHKTLSKRLTKLKDEDSKFQMSASEFLVYLKQFGKTDQREVRCLFDVQGLCEQYMNNPSAQQYLYLFQHYFSTVAEMQQVVRDTETHVLFPLTQMRVGCESEGQHEVNVNIQKKITNLKSALRDKTPFKLFSPQMDVIIPRQDRKIWSGMFYFIPASVSLISDIDQHIDDYMQMGNLMPLLKDYETKSKKSQLH